MRATVWSLCLAIALCALAAIARQNPYDMRIHKWELTLIVALIGLFLLANVASSVRPVRLGEGFAALGAIGGFVISIAFVAAELLVGPPQRIGGAPGQVYRPPHSAQLSVAFPEVDAGSLAASSPDSVVVLIGDRRENLAIGSEVRIHSYVLTAQRWPAAYVSARSAAHVGQTVTQRNGIAFVSPVLLFPQLDSDGLPVDSFEVPALHRDVSVKYYPGLPQRGIDIPFVQLEIDEENGGPLFRGVSVSGRQLKHAGLDLIFTLGSYPVVSMAPTPDSFMFVVGICMTSLGLLGFIIVVTRQSLLRKAA